MKMASSHAAGAANVAVPSISISRWVNEKLPSWNQILTAHDVARLTRRHRWMLSALELLGRFPKKQLFHGRRIGWRRCDVQRWLGAEGRASADTASAYRLPIQRPLELGCRCSRRMGRF